jgi:hypothetical protein
MAMMGAMAAIALGREEPVDDVRHEPGLWIEPGCFHDHGTSSAIFADEVP